MRLCGSEHAQGNLTKCLKGGIGRGFRGGRTTLGLQKGLVLEEGKAQLGGGLNYGPEEGLRPTVRRGADRRESRGKVGEGDSVLRAVIPPPHFPINLLFFISDTRTH